MPDHEYLRTHRLQAEHLLIDLDEASTDLRELGGDADRHAVTLIREGGMSVVLTDLKSGTVLQEHAAPGPTTVQVLAGNVRFILGDERFEVGPGRLVAFDGGTRHSVEAIDDSTLLLTLVAPREG